MKSCFPVQHDITQPDTLAICRANTWPKQNVNGREKQSKRTTQCWVEASHQEGVNAAKQIIVKYNNRNKNTPLETLRHGRRSFLSPPERQHAFTERIERELPVLFCREPELEPEPTPFFFLVDMLLRRRITIWYVYICTRKC